MFRLKKIIIGLMLLVEMVSFGQVLNLTTGDGKKMRFSSVGASKTTNYKINSAGLTFDYDKKVPKQSPVVFTFGFDILKQNIDMENVKVYVIIPRQGEKLLVDAVMPKNAKRKKDSKLGEFLQSMDTKIGSSSHVSDMIVNEYNWTGRSGTIAKADPNILVSGKEYGYLFKFVIKGKGIPEEVIFQPVILRIKLIGAQNI